MMSTTSQPNRLRDLSASLVVFMVALPLCIAIAKACEMPAEAGIITGIIGGLVVGTFAGSPLQVSGPAAGLVVLVATLVQRLGPGGLGIAVALAGAMQFLAGVFRWGYWFRAVSPAVIHGMLAGIGLLIIASQVHVLVDDKPTGNALENLRTIPAAAVKAFNDHDDEFPHHRHAAVVGLCSIAALVGWNAFKPRALRLLPGALIAVLVGGAIACAIPEDLLFVTVQSNLLATITWINQSDGSMWWSKEVWMAAMSIALIASAESLLCAAAVDRLHSGPRTNFNRELAAQGVGNLLCGCLGALPMTGVIVRSAANVEAGATSRWSSVMHGLWLLIFVSLLPSLLGYIPTTSLAAILIVTGYKLLDVKGVRELWHTSRSEALIFAVTALTVVCTDLLVGVLTGVALAMLKLVWTFSHLKIATEPDPAAGRTVMRLEGAATFLRLPWLADELARVPPNTELHVDFEHLTYIDHACLEMLMNWEKQHESNGGSLFIDWNSLHGRFRAPSGPGQEQARGNLKPVTTRVA